MIKVYEHLATTLPDGATVIGWKDWTNQIPPVAGAVPHIPTCTLVRVADRHVVAIYGDCGCHSILDRISDGGRC